MAISMMYIYYMSLSKDTPAFAIDTIPAVTGGRADEDTLRDTAKVTVHY